MNRADDRNLPKYAISTWIALATLAATPAIFATGWTSHGALRTDLAIGALGVALAAWAGALAKRRALPRAAFYLAPLAGLAAWALLSIAWSGAPLAASRPAMLFAAGAALAAALAAPQGETPDANAVLGALAAGALAAGLIGVLDALGLGLALPVWDPPGPTGSFDRADEAAAFYIVALPLITAGLFAARRGKQRAFFGASLLAAAAHFVLLTVPWRVALPLALGALAAGALVATATRRRAPIAAALLLALVCAASALLGQTELASARDYDWTDPAVGLPQIAAAPRGRDLASLQAGPPRSYRFSIRRIESAWRPDALEQIDRAALNLDWSQAALGAGPGAWWRAQTGAGLAPQARDALPLTVYPAWRAPHRDYVRLAFEYGVPGLAFLAALFACIAAAARRAHAARPQPADDEALWLWGASSATLGAAGAMGFVEITTEPAAWLSFCAAFALIVSLIPCPERPVRRGGALAGGALGIGSGAIAVCLISLSIGAGFFRGRADQLLAIGAYERARADYARASSIFPAYAEDRVNYALAARARGDARGALPSLDEAIELGPNDARTWHLKAGLHLAEREPERAIEAGRRALLLFPHFGPALEDLATAYAALNRFDEAAPALEGALAATPDPVRRASIHERLAAMRAGPLGDPSGALKSLNEARALRRDHQADYARLSARIEELKKRVARERLQRENKPIPPSLLPAERHNPADEILGAPHDHEH